MNHLPNGLVSLLAMILMLGIRHGFDADHLAAIDGMTRCNQQRRPKLARLAGVLFSVGHGLIIVPVSVGAATFSFDLKLPNWLDAFGTWTSVFILLWLAGLNIVSVIRTPNDQQVHLQGWRYGLLSRLVQVSNPLAVMTVGALFALSFDTLSQATLFAVISKKYQSWEVALGLAIAFVIGMLVTDGLNGLFISRLIKRADKSARIASRTMALSVSSVSVLVAVITIGAELSEDFDTWRDGKEAWFGFLIIGILIVSYFVGQRLARTKAAPAISTMS